MNEEKIKFSVGFPTVHVFLSSVSSTVPAFMPRYWIDDNHIIFTSSALESNSGFRNIGAKQIPISHPLTMTTSEMLIYYVFITGIMVIAIFTTASTLLFDSPPATSDGMIIFHLLVCCFAHRHSR